MTLRIARDRLDAYEAFSLDRWNANAKRRRDRNRANGECINQNKRGSHAKPEPGKVRCALCVAIHKYGAEVVRGGHFDFVKMEPRRRIPVSARTAEILGGAADEVINRMLDDEFATN